MIRPLLVLLCSLALPADKALAAMTYATVMEVGEGDTVTLHDGQEFLQVRLYGVDAPEIDQAYGEEAQRFLAGLVLGEDVHVTLEEPGISGPQAALLTLPDGRALHEELLCAGLAWWHRQAVPEDIVLSRLEREAQTRRRGLWAQSTPIPPWEFRLQARSLGQTLAEQPEVGEVVTARSAVGNVMVYKSRGNNYYHRRECELAKEGRTPVLLMVAARMRLKPCTTCSPPAAGGPEPVGQMTEAQALTEPVTEAESSDSETATPAKTPHAADSSKKEVFILKNRNEYHREGCTLLGLSGVSVKPKEALEWGYAPCKTCKPFRPKR